MKDLITIRNFIIIVISLGAVLMTVGAVRNYQGPGTESTFELISDDVDLTLQNISYTKTRSGEARWTLEASMKPKGEKQRRER